jgi:hypothetical protein
MCEKFFAESFYPKTDELGTQYYFENDCYSYLSMFFLQAVRGLSGAFIRLPSGGRSEPLGRDLR